MKRPQSAKQVRNYWAQISTDEGVAKDHSKPFLKMNNKQVMNAVSCNNDFSRLLPKRIQHDKQRLYCQALQLKSNLNQVTQENLRLKTKIAILQRQKDKKYRKDDQFQRGANIGSKTRINEKQQGIVLNLKKLVRQSKEEGQNHKKELLKLKRALRYTKMNELQIEKQTIYAQNRNLAKKIQKLQNQLANQLNQIQQNQNLAVQLQATLNNLKEIQIDNQKYEQLLQEMEMKNKQLSQKIVVLQQKMNRDIAVQKRKADLLNKQNEALRRQNKLLAQKIQQQKKRTNNAKKIIRPASSHPQSNSLSIKNQEVESTKSNPNRQKEIALQINAKLQNELSEARKKLAASQNQLKQQLKNNTLNLSNQPFELDLTKYQAGQLSSHTQKLTNFDKKSKNEVISKTSNPKSANNRKKDEYQSKAIKQLRQILTYRMKYKRYTFQQLKGDIQASPMTLFTYRDLNAMLLDEPFSLNSYYATQFLKVCYGKTKIGQDEEIESDCLINNLRKIIDQFELIDQHEQQQMLYKIADYLTKKRQILNKEFTKLKTKNKLVNKKQIADILSRFAQLSSEEIDLVISYISVNAQNLQKINYEEVLDKFYLNNSQNISQSSSENYSQRIQEKDEELSLGEEEELDQNEQLYGQDQII